MDPRATSTLESTAAVYPLGTLCTYRAVQDYRVPCKVVGAPVLRSHGIMIPVRVTATRGPWRSGELVEFNNVWLVQRPRLASGRPSRCRVFA